MTATTLVWSQLQLEQKSFWRNRQAAFFSFIMPLMFVVLFGALFGGRTLDVDVHKSITFREYFVAGMIGVSLLSATYIQLAIALSLARDNLVLKRMLGTPLPPSSLFAGKVLNAVVVVVLDVVVILGLGTALYGIGMPKNVLTFVVFVMFGIATFSMLGIAMTAFVPNGESAPAVVQPPYLVLMFISGVWFPFSQAPKWLQAVANVFPLRWLIDGIRVGYLGYDFVHTRDIRVGGHLVQGVPTPVHGLHALTSQWLGMLIMGAWLALATVIALTRFRWEPRGP